MIARTRIVDYTVERHPTERDMIRCAISFRGKQIGWVHAYGRRHSSRWKLREGIERVDTAVLFLDLEGMITPEVVELRAVK